MHITHIIWNIDAIGGAERMVVNIVAGFKNVVGVDISVISICGKGRSYYSQKLSDLGVNVSYLCPTICKAYNPEITLKLIGIIKKLFPDIIHTHLWGASFHGFLCAKFLRKPIVVHEHNVLINREWYHNLFDKITFGYRDNTIACSMPVFHSLIEVLKLNREISQNITVIENCIDELSLFPRKTKEIIRKEIGLDRNDLVFINVASLTEQKGHKYLIRAFSKIAQDYNNAKLLLIGEGNFRNEITSLIWKYNISGEVFLLGLQEDVFSLLNASDIFVLPSLWEGLPMVLLEAMYMKLPVIVTNVGVMKSIVKHTVNGLLVNPGDDDDLYGKMKYIIDNQNIRNKLGKKGQGLRREVVKDSRAPPKVVV
jgi:glycosyltransferase involved in cell wall biosynthesis